jgi:hypothetical protein
MALPPRQRVTPLNWQTPMVDPATGYPTPQFIRLWQQLFGNEEGTSAEASTALTDAEAALAAAEALEARNINTGFGLSGGGNLTADRTLSLGNPALTDPNADRGLFWDDSAGKLDWLTFGTGLTVTGTTLEASGGGGGGGSSDRLLPILTLAPSFNGGPNINSTQMTFVSGYASNANPITGIAVPITLTSGAVSLAPCIYNGGSSLLTAVSSLPLVASGPSVLLTAGAVNSIPFSAPFVPIVGNFYYIGFCATGGSNWTCSESQTSRRFWFAGGTFNPPPATSPAGFTSFANNGLTWWTY